MSPPLAQAVTVSGLLATLGLALCVAAHVAGMREHRGANRAAVFDAWRAVSLYGFWAALIFATAALDPRLYMDDYYQTGLCSMALWGGALALALAYTVQRITESPRAHRAREEPPTVCGPCGTTTSAADTVRPTLN